MIVDLRYPRLLELSVLLGLVLGACTRVPSAPVDQGWDSILSQVSSSVVSITAWKPESQGHETHSVPSHLDPSHRGVDIQMGSGFVYRSDGLILTNQHVVRGASLIRVEFLEGRQTYLADIIGEDDLSDIALLQLRLEKSESRSLPLKELTWGASAHARVGEGVVVIGNPYGFSHSVSTGVLSSIERVAPLGVQGNGWGAIDADTVLQTDAAIHPGSSGGPVLNRRGELIGMTTLFYSRSGEPSGISFAIPSDRILRVAEQLVSYGRLARSWLGIAAQEIEAGLSVHLGAFGTGVLITEVGKNTPASGILRSGDIVLSCDGVPVNRLFELRERIQTTPPGQDLKLEMIRNGVTLHRKVRPIEWGDRAESESKKRARSNVENRFRAGELRQQHAPASEPVFLGMRFAQPPHLGQGAQVVSLEPSSPAWLAGVMPGDWIVEINGQEILTPEQLPTRVARQDLGDIVLTVRQGGAGGPKIYRWLPRKFLLASRMGGPDSAPSASTNFHWPFSFSKKLRS
jgi:serine protease Do